MARLLKILALFVMTSSISGILVWHLMPVAANCQILYVSQDEIMDFEQDRVKNDELDNRQLFFGEIETAIKLAMNIPKFFKNRKTKIIYSIGKVSGEHVRSISKEVHEKIIKLLKKK